MTSALQGTWPLAAKTKLADSGRRPQRIISEPAWDAGRLLATSRDARKLALQAVGVFWKRHCPTDPHAGRKNYPQDGHGACSCELRNEIAADKCLRSENGERDPFFNQNRDHIFHEKILVLFSNAHGDILTIPKHRGHRHVSD